MTIKVLIADVNLLFMEILAKRFSETTDIKIVAQAKDGLDVLEKVRLSKPDIVLMEIGMPHLNGIETSLALNKEFPGIKTIALTNHTERFHVKDMLKAYAWGYLLKNCTYDQLVDAITQVHAGKKYFSTDVEGIIIENYLERESPVTKKLTERESRILKLLAEGKSIREISEMLFVSIKTVGTHKQNVFNKLGFENMAQLIKYALNNGIAS